MLSVCNETYVPNEECKIIIFWSLASFTWVFKNARHVTVKTTENKFLRWSIFLVFLVI